MSSVVVLVHGLFKSRRDMRFLEEGLQKFGYQVLSVKLPTTFGSLETCRRSLQTQLEDLSGRYEQVSFVAHSMGGLIVRDYLASAKLANVTRCVFIATPHRGTRLADVALRLPGAGRLFPPLLELQTQRRKGLTRVDTKIGIGLVIGTKNTLFLGRCLLSSRSDGRVEASSASAEDARASIELPFHHLNIHFKPETLLAVDRFLKSGHF